MSVEIYSHCASTDEKLARMWIVELNNEGKLRFNHRTFAEFYVACCFVLRVVL